MGASKTSMIWHRSRDTFPAFAPLLKLPDFLRCVDQIQRLFNRQNLELMALVINPELRFVFAPRLAHGRAITVRLINGAKNKLTWHC